MVTEVKAVARPVPEAAWSAEGESKPEELLLGERGVRWQRAQRCQTPESCFWCLTDEVMRA